MTRPTTLFLLLFLGIAACQPQEGAPAEGDEPVASTAGAADTADAHAAIRELSAAYLAAERAGDEAAVSALHADDATILPGNEPSVSGRAALDAYFAANSGEPEEVTFTTVHVGVSSSGDLGYEIGTTSSPEGTGKYLTVYRRTPEGWRIVADSWSGDAPPPAAE